MTLARGLVRGLARILTRGASEGEEEAEAVGMPSLNFAYPANSMYSGQVV